MKITTNILYPAFTMFALACLAFLPKARATCQEGCLTNDNTVLGDDALPNNTGSDNTAIGFNALLGNTSGGTNTAVGSLALPSNTTGSGNVAVGDHALFFNTTGGANTAVGPGALFDNTTGFSNTALGGSALRSNHTGFTNTAIGAAALYFNTTGYSNTATGYTALYNNGTGNYNTASGNKALTNNTAGNSNTATGDETLVVNTTGNNNTATGSVALFANSTGNNNTATGVNALQQNTIGTSNTSNGASALLNNSTGNNNTAVGSNALLNNTTGGSNIALGFQAGMNVTGNNNIDIGNVGVASESKTIRIGTAAIQRQTFIAGVSGATVPTGVPVIVDTTGHLGTSTSSARFKEAIKPMDKGSEAILALQPVTFRYKHELDPDGIPQFGLVAEEVEKVNPNLVARDDQGKPYTVRYEAVNAMLLNEFLKEHKKVEQLETTVAKLAAAVEKVSAQVQVNKPGPQIVLNSQ